MTLPIYTATRYVVPLREERFHWLTTPRSAVLQTSPVHAGRTREPATTLERLFRIHVQGRYSQDLDVYPEGT